MDPRWMGGEMWGYVEDDRLVSLCHSAANLMPVLANDDAISAFAHRARTRGRTCSTIIGPHDMVAPMWALLSDRWGTPREFRWDQPHLETTVPPLVAPDPQVRRSAARDLDLLYPACVAMYTEEVGVSPEAGSSGRIYRERVAQLISRGWSFVRFENDRVVFKAEIACATPYACQVQGVYVAPEHRGEGLAVPAMAAVVDIALREVAPVVTLYVNAHNTAARRVYERVGFTQTGTFSTIMF